MSSVPTSPRDRSDLRLPAWDAYAPLPSFTGVDDRYKPPAGPELSDARPHDDQLQEDQQPDAQQLAELDERFQHEPAEAVLAWAVEQFHPRLCLAASMSDAVLIDMAVRMEPSTEVVFIDTGYHFPETIQTLERVQRRYGIRVRVMGPPSEPAEFWKTDPAACCSAYKVAQLDAALESKLAWMSGLRRAESPLRAGTPIVSRDGRGLVKVNPLANWSEEDVERYVAEHDVPVNPLVAKGYLSIGCWPCTRPVRPGEHSRDGRWPGLTKSECGLHV